MSVPREGLLLYFKLDEITADNKVRDLSGNGNDGVLSGGPQIVFDETLGSCMSCDGVDDFIEVADTRLNTPNRSHTLSAWVKVEAYPAGRSWIALLGQEGASAHHWLLHSSGVTQCGVWEGTQINLAIKQPNFLVPKSEWRHFAITFDGATMTGYCNGMAVGSGVAAVFNFASKRLTLGKKIGGEQNFAGKLAHVRLYNRALAPAEVQQDYREDLVALAAQRKLFPLDFNVHDERAQNVLYIDDHPNGSEVQLEITNTSRQGLALSPWSNDPVSANNHNFELRFRPGVLANSTLAQMTVADRGWSLQPEVRNDGTLSLYLLANWNFPIDPSATNPHRPCAVTLFGNATLLGTEIHLTNAAGSQRGTAIISTPQAGLALTDFVFRFKVFLQGGTGADGMSWNYGEMPDNIFTQVEEMGAGSGLAVCLRTYGRQDLEVRYNNEVIATKATPTRPLNWAPVEIRMRAGRLTVTINSLVVLSDWPVPNWNPKPSWRFGFGARTGGAFDNHWIRDLALECTPKLEPGQRINLTLQKVKAEGSGGSRGTKVELCVKQIAYIGENAPLYGTRLKHLTLINHRGQKYWPVHVGFAASNRVLNDGSRNDDLKLRLTNILKLDPLHPETSLMYFNGKDSATPSKIILSFDARPDNQTSGMEWALGSKSQVLAIDAALADWEVTKSTQGETPEWILTPKNKTVLGPSQHLQIALTNIISTLPTGATNLYVRYENIPGYWDGHFVCVLEKTPLVYKGTNVGIGVANAKNKLDIQSVGRSFNHAENRPLYVTCDNGEASNGAEFRHSNGTQGIGFGYNSIYATGTNADQHLNLMPRGNGNVGVGTMSPEAKVHVIHQNEGPGGGALILGPTGQANLRMGYDKEYSWIQSHGLKPLAINLLGNNIGVGTASAKNRLDIQAAARSGSHAENRPFYVTGDLGASDNGVEIRHSNGTQGIGFGYNSIYATGTNADQHLNIIPKGNGSVGVGTTNPQRRMHVMGQGQPVMRLQTIGSRGQLSQTWDVLIDVDDDNDQDLMFLFNEGRNTGNWASAWVEPNGGVRSNSDARLKEDVKPLENVLEKVLALQPSSFRWKGRVTEHRDVGLIAQQVEKVFPELVREKHDCRALNYDNFAVLALAAIQEQQKLIAKLEEKINRLEGKRAEQKKTNAAPVKKKTAKKKETKKAAKSKR